MRRPTPENSLLPRTAILSDLEVAAGLFLDLIDAAGWVILPQSQTLVMVHVEDRKFSNDSVHALCSGQWQIALGLYLRSAVLVLVCLHDHDFGLLRVGNKILNI